MFGEGKGGVCEMKVEMVFESYWRVREGVGGGGDGGHRPRVAAKRRRG